MEVRRMTKYFKIPTPESCRKCRFALTGDNEVSERFIYGCWLYPDTPRSDLILSFCKNSRPLQCSDKDIEVLEMTPKED
jgi:hypothetical protein